MNNNFLKEFLNVFWLRPENALLLALRAKAIQDYHKMINGNSIDVSCGDGFFSFISLGGKLSIDTDMFQSIKQANGVRKGNFDSFNHFDNSYKVDVISQPQKHFTYGSDWKRTLINKAEKLNFYENLIVHDNNTKFNFDDCYFNYIYTNSSYWVDNFEFHIKDLIRMLDTDGLLVLEMKVDNIINFTSRKYLPYMSKRFHEIIDAGRLGTWKGLKSIEYFEEFIKSLDGVSIEEIKPIYGGNIAKIWDVGLRPIFNPLVKMANNIDNKLRQEVKEEWIDIVYDMSEEYIKNYQVNEKDAIEYLIVLKKK